MNVSVFVDALYKSSPSSSAVIMYDPKGRPSVILTLPSTTGYFVPLIFTVKLPVELTVLNVMLISSPIKYTGLTVISILELALATLKLEVSDTLL